ncbi:hypothetical protein TSACC_21344 [Terrimicrobium sacchariphilum]|uniref:Quinol:cytochrome c oxidoreductase membrane protein n=1 Tax=Terrimicrobium sacchariphilum TaxID=690879 RepID=A0A146G5X7_TERSA|nr:DUF3341 domain-containing protein [Terrimicrobium sacchariphilum]GAT32941.1 hypothetical protein TSACC_21344 [Terrimicrobium sacchariphilum]
MDTAGNTASPMYGVGAEFASAADLLRVAKEIRAAGYESFDVFSPFPIHGMDKAVQFRRSPLGRIVFIGGLTGFLTAMALQYIPSAVIYPLILHGKPFGFFAIPAYFPILFETTVLFSAFTAFIGLLMIIGLPRFNHPLFNWERFKGVSADGFFAVIESRDPKFAPAEAAEFLASLGGSNVTIIHED